jgi:catechol 2,3-dioxygenase-like lactoylglutathione lyase family enzyme
MKLLRLDHVQLAMPPGGEPHARKFYCDILGLKEVPKPPELARRGGCWFGEGAIRLHLGVETDFRPARKAHPAFEVDELAFFINMLRDAGVAVTADVPIDGQERVHIADPFGNRIELIEGR